MGGKCADIDSPMTGKTLRLKERRCRSLNNNNEKIKSHHIQLGNGDIEIVDLGDKSGVIYNIYIGSI